MNEIDPESGLIAGEFSGIGRTQGPNEGTGEGWTDLTRKNYEQIGSAIQKQAAADAIQRANVIPGGLNVGFDLNWLGEQTSAGSAQGQKI